MKSKTYYAMALLTGMLGFISVHASADDMAYRNSSTKDMQAAIYVNSSLIANMTVMRGGSGSVSFSGPTGNFTAMTKVKIVGNPNVVACSTTLKRGFINTNIVRARVTMNANGSAPYCSIQQL